MYNYLKILVALIILVFASSCAKDKLIIEEDPCGENVNYDADIQTIIETNCSYSNCHDGSGSAPGNYNSYGGLLTFLNETFFETRVINNRDMPPSYALGPTSLTQEEIDLIKCWIQNDYAEN